MVSSRIPDDLYETLRKIKISLDYEYLASAPSIQDMVSVALQRLIDDWEKLDEKEKLLAQLLEQRRKARSLMGNRRDESAEPSPGKDFDSSGISGR